MNKQELQKNTLTLREIQNIKEEAVCGQPYAERVSLALALNLLINQENRGDYDSILDEFNHLENIAPATRTKPEGKFKRGVIKFLYHKHYSSGRHISRNLIDQLKFKKDGAATDFFETTCARIIKEHGEDPDVWPGVLAHTLAIQGYHDHANHGLTGDWIVFGKHEERNYYLGLATHEEGREPEHLLTRLRQNCEAEYPFIFVTTLDESS